MKRYKLLELKVNNITLPVKIYYEKRSSVSGSLSKRGVIIRIPNGLNRLVIDKEIKRVLEWAKKRVEKNIEHFKPKELREYKNDDILRIGKYTYKLKIEYKNKKGSSGIIKDDVIFLSISNRLNNKERQIHIRKLLSRLIGQHRLPELKKRINKINKKFFKKNINNIRFKDMKTRWGSCSSKGNINISTRLLFAPDDVLDYICVHELAHLIEMNHSKRFWSIVEKVMPDYKEKEKWLKENKDKCEF